MDYKDKKKERREIKRSKKRAVTGEEVISIFEKYLQEWKTIRIFNTMKQENPQSHITKEKVESIATGNCKIYPSEVVSPERYGYYLELREKIYLFREKRKQEKKGYESSENM
jgi:hypothetical protein